MAYYKVTIDSGGESEWDYCDKESKYYYGLEIAKTAAIEYMASRSDFYNKFHSTAGGEWISKISSSNERWFYNKTGDWEWDMCSIKEIELENNHQSEIEKLRKENAELRQIVNELKYLPGGPGYTEALSDWTSRQT